MSLGCLRALEEFYNTQIIISVCQTKIPSFYTVDVTITRQKVKLEMIQLALVLWAM